VNLYIRFGRYITAEDVGMETRDMDIVRDVTLMLLEFLKEGAGTHHLLPLMVYMGLKAAAKQTIWF
jgi:leucine dehydrogenase